MPKKLLKRFAPSADAVKNHPSLRYFARWLHDNNLWHLNRYSASLAVFIGLFSAFIPLPSQMPIALVLSIWWRANVPISVALVWLTNPITSPPIFYGTYRLGNFLLQREPHSLHFEASLAWLGSEIGRIWAPLLLGSLTTGIVAGLAGAALVRILWRVQIGMRWAARKKARAAR
jgi:uncharacterized protein (DUF2062 family)